MDEKCCKRMKRKEMLKTRKDKKKTLLVIGVLLFFVASAVFIVLSAGNPKAEVTEVQAAEGVVRIPVAEVQNGQARFYSYNSGGGAINFFVLRSSDGVVRAAFDSCDVCFRERKGYRQEGDFMICNNCGQRFPSAQINDIRGGCNPAPLERRVEGQYIVLTTDDIDQGRMYF